MQAGCTIKEHTAVTFDALLFTCAGSALLAAGSDNVSVHAAWRGHAGAHILLRKRVVAAVHTVCNFPSGGVENARDQADLQNQDWHIRLTSASYHLHAMTRA